MRVHSTCSFEFPSPNLDVSTGTFLLFFPPFQLSALTMPMVSPSPNIIVRTNPPPPSHSVTKAVSGNVSKWCHWSPDHGHDSERCHDPAKEDEDDSTCSGPRTLSGPSADPQKGSTWPCLTGR